MSKLQFEARVSWTSELISTDWTLTGQPPGHAERKWSSVEAWGMGRPDPTQVDGVWLLMKEAPFYHFVSSRSVGAVALAGELRRRGCPERSSAEVKQEADVRTLRALRIEVDHLFSASANEVWQLLESEAVFGQVNVRTAVVRLSKGNRDKLEQLVAAARLDPRDVLMWAQAERLI